MIAGRVFVTPIFLRFFDLRWLVRWLISVSTIYGFLSFYEMYSYLPWHHQSLKALVMTLEAHSGLWLATFEIRSRWRFLVALLLIPSGVGVYFLFWHRNFFTGIAGLMALGWLMNRAAQGERHDAQSI